MNRILIVTALGLAVFSGQAAAGEPVYGVDKDLGVALEKSVAAVEKAAIAHGTCVSAYPSLDTCEESAKFAGYFQCKAIRANHKGSCANKPSDLDNLIKAANGLSGPAAKAFLTGGQ
ncbi:hypothetical protein [Lysobacter sp. cf310]|uniref:hypothetical protein n=1 Tax=Lysobacter sp. cf310 TaxID=1761790 RepID=UPI0008EAACE9|nr:hypothetical protein [Lysobacter sp. cf310]SFK25998.1 hypothetical protein SAMN04487938_0045 [Lysobacter sp. cf310]